MKVNQKQFARILGITDRRVRELKELGFFQSGEGCYGYELEKCVPEYIEFKSKSGSEKGAIGKEEEQTKHEAVKRQISELKLKKMKRELHRAADVEFFLSNMLMSFKGRLLAIPGKIAIQLLNVGDINIIIALLEKEMLETLDELSEYDPEKIDGEFDPWESDEEEESEDESD